MEPHVQTSAGVVAGRAEGDLLVFRGIPYAAVPQRFAAPRPATGWVGVRVAESFGPAPPQSAVGGVAGSAGSGADWLTVNVWSPGLRAGLPVLVWIQGGGYLFGTSALPEYDGAVLAAGGLVVVTFNYRVGLEGFGLLPEVPANRGLLDQVAALRWVRDNIAGFGGDPDRVTVCGQSAGGGSVAALLAMPSAQGLFQRAIVQSMPGTYFTPGLAADLTGACAAELGVPVSGLADADPQLLALAGDVVLEDLGRRVDRWGRAAYAGILCAPVVDGDVLPTTPWEGLTGGVPLIAGHTRHEQRLLSLMSGTLGAVTAQQAREAAQLLAPDPQRWLAAFPDPDECFETVRSDWLFRMPTVHLAEAQVRAGGAAYLYELTWPAPGLGGALGACHGLDVPLVFGNLTAGQPALLIGEPTAEAAAVSQMLRRAWTDFATTGDPGWPTCEDGATWVVDASPAVVPYPEQRSRQLWPAAPGVLDLP